MTAVRDLDILRRWRSVETRIAQTYEFLATALDGVLAMDVTRTRSDGNRARWVDLYLDEFTQLAKLIKSLDLDDGHKTRRSSAIDGLPFASREQLQSVANVVTTYRDGLVQARDDDALPERLLGLTNTALQGLMSALHITVTQQKLSLRAIARQVVVLKTTRNLLDATRELRDHLSNGPPGEARYQVKDFIETTQASIRAVAHTFGPQASIVTLRTACAEQRDCPTTTNEMVAAITVITADLAEQLQDLRQLSLSTAVFADRATDAVGVAVARTAAAFGLGETVGLGEQGMEAAGC